MTTKKRSTGSSLTPRDRQRLLKEAEDRSRARDERPERQAANASRLAERRPSLTPQTPDVSPQADLAGRVRIADRTRNAAMEAWKIEHESQLAKRD